MPRSVLEAIKMGIWDFEPLDVEYNRYDASNAMPGTREKFGSWPNGPKKGFRCGMPTIVPTWRSRRRRF